MAVGTTSHLKVPDDQILAFAVCIVESKPKELKYITLLRQHIAKGRRENALSAVHRHLDRSAWWRSEYERVREDLDAAEQKQISLKLEIDRLKEKSNSANPIASPKKRKKQEDPDVVPVPRSPRRLRQDGSEKAGNLTRSEVDADFEFGHLGDSGDALMRSFYQAHAILKSREKTELPLLARHLVDAANAVCKIMRQLAGAQCVSQDNHLDTLKAGLTATSRATHSLLVGHGRISNVVGGSDVLGHVTYAFAQIVEASVSIMTDLARAEVEKFDQDLSLQQRPGQAPASKTKVKPVANSSTRQRKRVALATVSSFIAGTISLLDAKTESHKPLFEALAYILIERLAGRLYTLVFGRARAETLEEDILASARADDIEEADTTPAPGPDEMDVKVAKLEAPYLVQLLTRLMQAAPAYFDGSNTAKSGKSKGASKQAPLKDNLVITAKERLQRTLINCMFGTEGVDGDDDLFLDCLQKPVLKGSLPTVPAMQETEVQEWFKEEVWRLLGWDILVREGGW